MFKRNIQNLRPKVMSKWDVQKCCLTVTYKSDIQKWRTKVTSKSDVQKWGPKVTYSPGSVLSFLLLCAYYYQHKRRYFLQHFLKVWGGILTKNFYPCTCCDNCQVWWESALCSVGQRRETVSRHSTYFHIHLHLPHIPTQLHHTSQHLVSFTSTKILVITTFSSGHPDTHTVDHKYMTMVNLHWFL